MNQNCIPKPCGFSGEMTEPALLNGGKVGGLRGWTSLNSFNCGAFVKAFLKAWSQATWNTKHWDVSGI